MSVRNSLSGMSGGIIAIAALIGAALVFGALTAPPAPKPAAVPITRAGGLPPGYHGFPDPSLDPKGTEAEMKTLVRRTRGDYSLLTSEERLWLEGVTAHHGATALREMANHIDEMDAAEAAKKKTRHRAGRNRP